MRKKFAWFFCIFMSSLVLLSCSEDNKKGEEPGDGTGAVSYTHLTLPTTPYV